MRRPTRLLAALAAAAALLAGACGADAAPGSAPGRPAVDTGEVFAFEATTVSGEPFDGSDLEGRDVAVWFWAPW